MCMCLCMLMCMCMRARERRVGVEEVVHPLGVAVAHLPARAELVHRLNGGAERAYDREEDGEYAQEEVGP